MDCIQNFLEESSRDMEKKDSVKAIIYHNHQILILRRANDTPGGGDWDLPGGCIEENEKEIDALKREIHEETGLSNITDIKKLKTARLKIPEKGIDSDMHIYKCKSPSGDVTLKPSDWKGSDGKPEHTEYKWITDKIDLENLPMLEILKTVVLDEF